MFADQSILQQEDAEERKLEARMSEQRKHDKQLLREFFAVADKKRKGCITPKDVKKTLADPKTFEDFEKRSVTREGDFKDIKLALFDLVKHHEDDHLMHAMEMDEDRFVR